LWRPLRLPREEQQRGDFGFSGHAMLRPGVTLAEARTELTAIATGLAQENPSTNQGVLVRLRPLREEAVQEVAQLTVLLFGAVLFVFLIACANVANLLMARAASRTKEIAIRLALGAGRRRLVGQFLTESLLLGLLGGLGGLVLAVWGKDLMVAAIPMELPFWLRFDFDPAVFGFALGLSLLGGLLFGLVPAWQSTRPAVVEELKEGGRGTGGGARSLRFRHALVVAEIALALVLLVSAALLMRSFLRLQHSAPGFDARNVLTFRVGFPPTMAPDKVVLNRFFGELIPRLAALPGVEAAGATTMLPGTGSGNIRALMVEGQPAPQRLIDSASSHVRTVTPGLFAALRIPLLAGRDFAATDDADRPRVVVVDTVFVKRFLPGSDPLGRRIHLIEKPGDPPKWIEIVGVVGNVRHQLARQDPVPTVYLPQTQQSSNFLSVALRVRGDPAPLVATIRTEVFAVHKEIPIYNVWTHEHAIEREIWFHRFFGWLFAIFAAVALFLASIGIYGVMAFSVAQRTQEIGVRLALGAQSRDVIRLVVRRGLRLIALGLGLGFVAAFFATRLLTGNLYGVSPHDPPTFAVVPLFLAAVALVACWLPSRRATSVAPAVALRAE
jgi:predicted permease